jgi:hypothetical protein
MMADRLRLFAIYRTLVERAELRAALRASKLRELLLFLGSQIPAYLREDMNWLRHQPGFAAYSNKNTAEKFVVFARKHLNGEDTTKSLVELQPLEK